MRVGTFRQFIGGAISGGVLWTLISAGFMILFGIAPEQWVASIIRQPPPWLGNPLVGLALIVVGLVLVGWSWRFNRWSKKQEAINELAEELSFAIANLLNRDPRPTTENDIATWESDYREWCNRVSKKLENRAFFTRADQLHFDRLGFVEPVRMSGNSKLERLPAQLRACRFYAVRRPP